MNLFDEVKYGLAAGGLLALVFAVFMASNEAGVIKDQKAEIARHDACISALSGKDGGRDVGAMCDPATITYFDRAQHAATCDQALDMGGAAPECSLAVLSLVSTNTTLKEQITSTVADRDAAIARATARATAQATRKAQDEHALKAAPRQPDGLIVCDADCLRQRFEADAPH